MLHFQRILTSSKHTPHPSSPILFPPAKPIMAATPSPQRTIKPGDTLDAVFLETTPQTTRSAIDAWFTKPKTYGTPPPKPSPPKKKKRPALAPAKPSPAALLRHSKRILMETNRALGSIMPEKQVDIEIWLQETLRHAPPTEPGFVSPKLPKGWLPEGPGRSVNTMPEVLKQVAANERALEIAMSLDEPRVTEDRRAEPAYQRDFQAWKLSVLRLNASPVTTSQELFIPDESGSFPSVTQTSSKFSEEYLVTPKRSPTIEKPSNVEELTKQLTYTNPFEELSAIKAKAAASSQAVTSTSTEDPIASKKIPMRLLRETYGDLDEEDRGKLQRTVWRFLEDVRVSDAVPLKKLQKFVKLIDADDVWADVCITFPEVAEVWTGNYWPWGFHYIIKAVRRRLPKASGQVEDFGDGDSDDTAVQKHRRMLRRKAEREEKERSDERYKKKENYLW